MQNATVTFVMRVDGTSIRWTGCSKVLLDVLRELCRMVLGLLLGSVR